MVRFLQAFGASTYFFRALYLLLGETVSSRLSDVDVNYLLSLVISCRVLEMEFLKSRLEPESHKNRHFT